MRLAPLSLSGSLSLGVLALGLLNLGLVAGCAPPAGAESPVLVAEHDALTFPGVNSTKLREAFVEALQKNHYQVTSSEPFVETAPKTTDTPLLVQGKPGEAPTTIAWEISFGDSSEGAIAHPTARLTAGGKPLGEVSPKDTQDYLSSIKLDVDRLLGVAIEEPVTE